MKTLKVRALAIAGLVIAFAIAGIHNPAWGKMGGPPSKPYLKEKSDISNDVTRIKLHRESIQMLKKKCKADRKNGQRVAVIVDKKNLSKAKADLKRDKAYLRADKKDLVRDHREAVRTSKQSVRKERGELFSSRWQFFKDRLRGRKDAIKEDKSTVAENKVDLKKKKTRLDNERVYLNSDMIAVNKEIKKANGQFVGVIYTETALAKTKKWMVKAL